MIHAPTSVESTKAANILAEATARVRGSFSASVPIATEVKNAKDSATKGIAGSAAYVAVDAKGNTTIASAESGVRVESTPGRGTTFTIYLRAGPAGGA